ncbi:MAG: radical SAM family heme chaperone HemW [Acidobacteria bacterium]|nr:radical SAM family heme chaperone HemW [Acidobacteriota bacterium]
MALGVYISVPFCRSKCSYCNFSSDVFSQRVVGRYLDRLVAEVESAARTAESMGGEFERDLDTLYLGGGTPTILDSHSLERLFVTIRQNFRLLSHAEVTVECAPGTLSSATLALLARHHVNRVSLGVQSFIDPEAAAVGRLHNRTTVAGDLAQLRAAGITNTNLDLIAGLPHQTEESWDLSVQRAIDSGAPHVSVYMLEIDDESRLGRELLAGGRRYHAHFVPDEELIADLYLAACERLSRAGLVHYEISNFARPGFESRHNLKYWKREPYLGFGLDAHSMLRASADPYSWLSGVADQAASHVGGGRPCAVACADLDAVRFSTPDSLEPYLSGSGPSRTLVFRRGALEEEFFLGLRMTRGIDITRLALLYGADQVEAFLPAIGEFTAGGLMLRDRDVIRLTSRGRLLSNEIFARLLSVSESQVSIFEHRSNWGGAREL